MSDQASLFLDVVSGRAVDRGLATYLHEEDAKMVSSERTR